LQLLRVLLQLLRVLLRLLLLSAGVAGVAGVALQRLALQQPQRRREAILYKFFSLAPRYALAFL
jgi:hypothetical protein